MTDKSSPIAVAGTTCEEVKNLLPYACALSECSDHPVLALGLVCVPEGESLSVGARPAQTLRQELESLARQQNVRTMVRVAYHPWQEAEEAIRLSGSSLLLVNHSSLLPEEILRRITCDVLVVNGLLPLTIKQILMPVRGGPYAELSLRIALRLAQAHHAEISILHTVSSAGGDDPFYQEFLAHLRQLPEITRWITMRGDPARAILRTADPEEYQLLVMGAIAQPRPGDPPIGPTAARILEKVGIPTLVAKSSREFIEPSTTEGEAPPLDYTISVVVDKWFAENTFHAHEFQDIKRLLRLKEKRGLTISLGLPTLNEAATIGNVIRRIRTGLMRRFPLLDEIVLIDSDSTDETVQIAADMGIPVFRHCDILPEYGTFSGKGEALWKSLFILKGDLVAWIDTDIKNIHPRFVYGVLGPLLQEPHLQYVKGFYQRPLRIGRKLQARGGGRVTELAARPMINLFYPELSGMVQPLSGEYAGTRQALESLPFFSGYGVEIGLLLDLVGRYGIDSIGQVDLEERIHRNQTLFSLTKMSFAIIQVMLQRVSERRRIEFLNAMNQSLKVIRYEPEQFRLDVLDIRDHERPPMNTIPEYRLRHPARN